MPRHCGFVNIQIWQTKAGHRSTLRTCVFSFWRRSSVYVRLTAFCLRPVCVYVFENITCVRQKRQLIARVAHVLLLRRRLLCIEYACVQVLQVDSKRSDCSKAPRNPQKGDLCVLRLPVAATCSETQERNVDLWPAYG